MTNSTKKIEKMLNAVYCVIGVFLLVLLVWLNIQMF